MPIENEDSVTYICNMVDVFVQYTNNMKCSLKSMCTLFFTIQLMLITPSVAHICIFILHIYSYERYLKCGLYQQYGREYVFVTHIWI